MIGAQYLQEDVEIDPSILKTEKRTKQLREIRTRVHRISADYRQRLHDAGLDDVVSSYEKKGIGNEDTLE